MASDKTKRNLFLANIKPGDYSDYSERLNSEMARYKQLYGASPYWNEFLANPALNMPSYFSTDRVDNSNYSFWTDTFRTREDSALQYMSQLVGKIQEEQYNSALGDVARTRQSGANPDLVGLGSGGEATEFDDAAASSTLAAQPSLADYNLRKTQNNLSVASSITDTLLSFLSTSLSVGQQIIGMKSGSLDNLSKEFSVYTSGSDAFDKFLMNYVPRPTKTDVGQGADPLVEWSSYLQGVLDDPKFNEALPFKGKTRKLFRKIAGYYPVDSLKSHSLYEALAKSYFSDRKDRVKTMSSPVFDDDASEWISKFTEKITDVEYSVWENKQKVQKLMLDFDRRYYSKLNSLKQPESLASDENKVTENDLSYQTQLGLNDVPKDSADVESESLQVAWLRDQVNKLRLQSMEDMEKELDKIHRLIKTDPSTPAWLRSISMMIYPFLRSKLSADVDSYFQNAMQSLGGRVSHPSSVSSSVSTNFDF